MCELLYNGGNQGVQIVPSKSSVLDKPNSKIMQKKRKTKQGAANRRGNIPQEPVLWPVLDVCVCQDMS